MSEVHKHPKALPICFLTEMWERFGYMLLSISMVFILIQRFDLPDARANLIVGSYSAMLYVTSVFAGVIADRLIGYYRSIIVGSIVLIIGYGYLAFAMDLDNFCIALGFVCTGTGLVKTNVGSYLGENYRNDEKSRQSGFTTFYVGINLGAILGISMSGYIYQHFSGVGLALTAMCMLSLGLASFYGGFKLYKLKIFTQSVSLKKWFLAIVVVVISIIVSLLVIYIPALSNIFFIG